MQKMRKLFANVRPQLRGKLHSAVLATLVLTLTLMPTLATHAQGSLNIDFSADDLDIFFDWFNMIFAALLPIALLGAGLTAGGVFVWVIGGMLVKAFKNMIGGGAA